MLKIIRMAGLAAGLLIAVGATTVSQFAHAQGQPAAPAASSESAAPAAPMAAPKATATEVVENPYGLEALWKGGDIVARITLGILVIMSMGSWYVIITKLVEQFVLSRQAREAERSFWRAPSARAGAEALGRRSAFRMIVEDGLRATEQQEGTLADQIDPEAWIALSLQHAADAVINRMQRGLAFLATVGSTAAWRHW